MVLDTWQTKTDNRSYPLSLRASARDAVVFTYAGGGSVELPTPQVTLVFAPAQPSARIALSCQLSAEPITDRLEQKD